MASKNEKPTQSSKSTTRASGSKIPVVVITENSENTDMANEEVCKEKTGGANKKIEDKEKVFKSRAMLEKEVAEKSRQLDALELQVKQLQETLRGKQIEEAQEKSTRTLYETAKVELAKAQEELQNLAGKSQLKCCLPVFVSDRTVYKITPALVTI